MSRLRRDFTSPNHFRETETWLKSKRGLLRFCQAKTEARLSGGAARLPFRWNIPASPSFGD
jgi:hypothetical protein